MQDIHLSFLFNCLYLAGECGFAAFVVMLILKKQRRVLLKSIKVLGMERWELWARGGLKRELFFFCPLSRPLGASLPHYQFFSFGANYRPTYTAVYHKNSSIASSPPSSSVPSHVVSDTSILSFLTISISDNLTLVDYVSLAGRFRLLHQSCTAS